jgi:flagellar biosynthesis activator protein FlaF
VNAILQAQSAYAATGTTLRTGRQAEHQVLATVTARLGAALQGGRFDRIAAALHDNRRLWTRLAADVADPENGLPQRLRAQIFYLAEFTQAHSRRVLRGEADLQALIDVNAAVMRGLGATPEAPDLSLAGDAR